MDRSLVTTHGAEPTRPVARLLAVAMVAFPLSGCPIPIPVCENKQFEVLQVPVVDLQSRGAAELPTHFGIVLGRIELKSTQFAGRISLDLVALEDDAPKAARKVWLRPDGAFLWALPPGKYVIATAELNHDYQEGAYQQSRSFKPGASFLVNGGSNATYVGSLRLKIDDSMVARDLFHEAYVVTSADVIDGFATDRSIVATARAMPERPFTHQLMSYDPAMEPVYVPRTMVCHDWNMCWGIIAGEASACFNEDR